MGWFAKAFGATFGAGCGCVLAMIGSFLFLLFLISALNVAFR